MIELLKEYSLPILLTLSTLFTFYWIRKHGQLLKVPWYSALILALVHTLVGVGCVKIFAVLETLDFDNAGQMSLFGAVFFLPLIYWLGAKLTKRSVSAVFDVFTPAVVFTLLCARINCILSGCCLGEYIPWVVGIRWPTRELEILFYIVLLAWLLGKGRQNRIPGISYPVYMTAYGAFRFLIEGFRESDSSLVIHISHIWAAVAFTLGLSIYSEITKMNKQKIALKGHTVRK